MNKPKILVTGGAGYIGSHTVVKLIEAGMEPIIIDNFYNSNISSIDGIAQITGQRPKLYEVDIRNYAELDEVIAGEGRIDGVIHFAALKAVAESADLPVEYYDVNVGGLIQLLKVCKEREINNIIFSSSATVYGIPDTLPIKETHPLKPATNPYGNSKRICEEILMDSTSAIDALNTILLRYFNPIGAHESHLIGEMPSGIPNNLMPYVTQVAAGIRPELQVFGNDYDTPDGTGVRDYIHVEDLAEAHVVAVQRLLDPASKNEKLEIFNLGTGNGFSVMEIIQNFEATTGVKVPYKIVDRRQGDAPSVYADTAKANEKLGWKAKRTLADMTLSSWKWESQYRSMNVE